MTQDSNNKDNEKTSNFTINKPIAIPLYGFEFRHTSDPSEDPKKDHMFIGRKKIIDKLVDIFKCNRGKRGSYLIAGYRGVGKTSVVKKAIKICVDDDKPLLVVDINLGDNSSLTPLNIYFSMASILRDEIKNKKGGASWLKVFFQPIVSIQRVWFVTFLFLLIIAVTQQTSFATSFFYEYLFYFLLLPVLFWLVSLYFFPEFKVLKDIDDLIEAMSYEVSESKNIGLIYKKFNFGGFSKNKKRQPIHSREAEERLSEILERLSKCRSQVIFILDEIDKLSDYEERAEIGYNEAEKNKTIKIDSMLGSLKNYFTTAKAIFIFISGRETLDRYYSEKGSPNSLYESLFDQVFEIPSFLTDEGEQRKGTQLTHLVEEYVCRCLRKKNDEASYYTLESYYKSLEKQRDKKEAHRLISILRVFIHYLTFHSWGNPKRLSSLFESFVVPQLQVTDNLRKDSYLKLGVKEEEKEEGGKAGHWLIIDTSHHHRFSLASDMITLFQHQVNREISRISDKLTVSTLASLHFILKLHSYGFTRESLHRMSEALNVHRSPELNTIIDDLLTHVLKSYIRRIRNGAYRYRFNSSFEQELRHISQYSDLESASHNFSLDSMKHVKRVFENVIANKSEDVRVIAGAHVTLGDICAIEQSYNDASVHYRTASNIFAIQMLEENKFMKQEILMQYTEAMIKQGDLEERRQNYNYAAAIYSDAEQGVASVLNKSDAETLCQSLQDGDSKLDTLKQPFWAGKFLSLKRSPRGKTTISRPNYLYHENDPRYHLRAANLFFFLNDIEYSAQSYEATLRFLDQDRSDFHPDERNAYLGGNAKVGLAETTLIKQSNIFFEMQLKTDSPEKIAFFEPLLEFSNKPTAMGIYPFSDIDLLMEEAAKCFEVNQLHISAAITYIKIICYYSQMLDIFDSGIAEEFDDKDVLKKVVKKTKSIATSFGTKALECINKARQLETSQGCKTLLMRDLDKSDDFDMNVTQLFNILSGNVTDSETEMSFWQHSIWAHKLAASLLWADFVVRKAEERSTPQSKLSYMPNDLSLLSARSSITVRWIHARELSHQHIYKKLVLVGGCSVSAFRILDHYKNKGQNISLSAKGRGFVGYCMKPNGEGDEILINAYHISRYLYFALRSIRFTSRKNIDLVFPSMTQIYYIQWKLLSNLLIAMLVHDKQEKKDKRTSIGALSFRLQQALVGIDEKEAPHERIPASHFDYEYIFMLLNTSLGDSINLVDKTSRTRTNILQNKYFCHDDHSDPEFKMDYTLAYMFIPSAQYLSKHINKIHNDLEEAAASIWHKPHKPHKLSDIFFITLSAVICGANDWLAVEKFGKAKQEWLTRQLELINGIPSHNTFSDIVEALDTEQFGKCFLKWIENVRGETEEAIVIDEHRFKLSVEEVLKEAGIHMVRTWAQHNSLVLGEMEGDESSNESIAIPALLSRLDINGAVVMIDSMSDQKSIAKKIIQRKGGYVLSLKKSEDSLFKDVDAYFTSHLSKDSTLEKFDDGRRCVEACIVHVIDETVSKKIRSTWSELRSIIAVTTIIKQDDKVSKETRYFLSSLSPDRLGGELKYVVWWVEWVNNNQLHWVLDISFDESRSDVNGEKTKEIISKIGICINDPNEKRWDFLREKLRSY